MPPKKPKSPKQLLAISQLTAFLSIYKAACKRYGVTPDKGLLEEVEKKLIIAKPLDKVILRGPHHGAPSLRAVLDAMAGYAPVRNLICWGCNIGDEGLRVICQLLRGVAAKTWVGGKPRMLEIVNDASPISSDRWPEHYVEQVNGTDMVTRGSGFQLPSVALGQTQAVTLDTIRLQQDPGETAALDLIALDRQLSALLAPASLTTTLTYEDLSMAKAVAASLTPASALATSLTPPTSVAAVSGSGVDGWSYPPPVHPADGRTLLHPPRPQTFGNEAVKDLSLALATQGNMLQILVLDHNQLGDVGAKLLAPGIRRCKPLQQLSLAHCGIGPEGAMALAAAFKPDTDPVVAQLQPKFKVLNLGHNPLCAAGVKALAGSLLQMASLKVLLLADVDLGSEAADLDALQGLVDFLATNTAVDQVDLDGNHIGDAGAGVVLPFLQSQTHIRKFRVSPRLSRTTMQAVQAAVRANLPKKKKVVRKKKAAKKF